MERFVTLVVAGGVVLVAALWVTTAVTPWSVPWLLAAGVAAASCASLLAGIAIEVDV